MCQKPSFCALRAWVTTDMCSRYYYVYTDEGTGLARVATHGNPRLKAGSSNSIIWVIHYNAVTGSQSHQQLQLNFEFRFKQMKLLKMRMGNTGSKGKNVKSSSRIRAFPGCQEWARTHQAAVELYGQGSEHGAWISNRKWKRQMLHRQLDYKSCIEINVKLNNGTEDCTHHSFKPDVQGMEVCRVFRF